MVWNAIGLDDTFVTGGTDVVFDDRGDGPILVAGIIGDGLVIRVENVGSLSAGDICFFLVEGKTLTFLSRADVGDVITAG